MRSAAVLEIGRDALVLIGGVVLVVSTPYLPVGDREVTGALLILGLLLAGTALWAMGSASRSSHWAHLVFGALVLASPWMLQFPANAPKATALSVVVGAVAVLAGVGGVMAARKSTTRVVVEHDEHPASAR